MNHVQSLKKHVKSNGIRGVLPQNLTQNIFNRMIKETDSFRAEDGKTPSTLMMMSIMYIHTKNKKLFSSSKAISFDIPPDEMHKMFVTYSVAINMENLSRTGKITIENSSPTIDNIFDEQREVSFITNNQ